MSTISEAAGGDDLNIEFQPKGLKSNALGLFESTGIGIASTAPAYSLAGTLGFVIAIIGLQTPLLVLIAFVPMFALAWATKHMNTYDPDCGTSFTWAARVLGPKTGWFAGGWGTIASDFLAMGSYAQIAGQYVFLLFGLKTIGENPTSPWVLAVGIAWIVGLTWICVRGIQLSARLQVALVTVEVIMLLVLAAVALIKLYSGNAPAGHIDPSWSWFSPAKISSFGVFMQGMLLMVFIYWGWDTTVSVNEETKEPGRIPGTAGVISTFLLLATYLLVIVAVQGFAGIGTTGIGLGNTNNQGDVLSVLGTAVFGTGVVGDVLSKLLILMVLTSAAATTQTTILPNARTMLSMAFHKALPAIFGRVHPRYLTPIFSTVSFAVLSVIYYVALNFISHGNVISDAVTATTFFAALYLAITGVACFWHYRGYVRRGARAVISYLLVPAFGAASLFLMIAWSFKTYWAPDQSYVEVNIFGITIGGVLLLVGIATIVGLLWMWWCTHTQKEFFSGASMRTGLSLTDDDAVVKVEPEPEAPA